MTPEEAVRRVGFWTTLGNQAIGSTTDPEVGAWFQADSVPREAITDPQGPRIYAIQIPRYVTMNGERIPNHLYAMIEKEIERRGAE